MSVRVMELVWRSSVKAPLRWLLLALADRANDAGECWPSLTYLARRMQVTRRQVIRLIAEAVAAGYVSRIVGGPPDRTTRYRLNLDRLRK